MDQANSFKDLGNKEYASRNFARAIEYYSQAIGIRADPIFYTNRATCYIELRKFERAIEDAWNAINTDPAYLKAYFRGAQAYTHIGKLEEAFSLIKKGIEQNPNEQTIRREYDNLQILIGYKASLEKHLNEAEYSDALRKVNALLERSDADITLVNFKINVLCLSNDVKTAKAFLKEKESAIKRLSEDTYYWILARVDRYSNDLANAKINAQKGLALNPDAAILKQELSIIKSMEDIKKRATDAFTAKNFDEAFRLYEEAIKADPLNRIWKSVILSNQASCLMSLKRNKEALELMKQSTELDQENAKFLYKRGKLEKDLNDWEAAEQSMRKAKTIDPSLTIDNDLKEITKKVKEMNKKDYYAILGVDKKATTEDVKKAYKDLVKKWHPDKHAGNKDQQEKAEKKFKEINEAFNVISDPEKRKRYDIGGSDEDNFGGFHNMHDIFGQGGADPLIQMFFNSGSRNTFTFGGAGGAGGRGNQGRNQSGFGGSQGQFPFGFSNFFSGNDSDDFFRDHRRR